MPDVNVLAVIVAALSSFLLGGAWYSAKLFGDAWRRAAPTKRSRNRAPIFLALAGSSQ